ncbi:hypothetical protein [Niabella beijingensis]|uniref:hypothetical protein n=1 Tax=Niabella beijingensis TaxID=2872700 RepID=UPI001CBC8F53|nr:hypothetical protein [Niabella beijingensis]MBZ4187466.1 hypothetical protein [Niabella beijingensis]
MKVFFLYLFLLGGTLWAHTATGASHRIREEKERVMAADTIPPQKKDVPARDKNTAAQNVPKGKPIKEVPKAKNQAKPKMVAPPGLKMKPIKIIKPKINGKGLGR